MRIHLYYNLFTWRKLTLFHYITLLLSEGGIGKRQSAPATGACPEGGNCESRSYHPPPSKKECSSEIHWESKEMERPRISAGRCAFSSRRRTRSRITHETSSGEFLQRRMTISDQEAAIRTGKQNVWLVLAAV